LFLLHDRISTGGANAAELKSEIRRFRRFRLSGEWRGIKTKGFSNRRNLRINLPFEDCAAKAVKRAEIVANRKKSRYVPPLFTPKIGDEEAIEIAIAYADSKGVNTDGCQSCHWVGFGGYLISLKMPADEIPATISDPDDAIAMVVSVDNRTGAADQFFLL
jgi:hypothetical protein